MNLESDIIKTAIEFVKVKHADQTRKFKKEPYVNHLFKVYYILLENNADETTLVAGLLHDVLEDTKTKSEEIEKIFGPEVTGIVLGETENKSLTWKERKIERIEHIKTADLKTKMVKCADLLANIQDTHGDLMLSGNDAWKIFKAPKEEVKWYYRSMIKNLTELKNTKMFSELVRFYKKTFCSNLFYLDNNTYFLDKLLSTPEKRIKFERDMEKLLFDGKSIFSFVYKLKNVYVLHGMDSYDCTIDVAFNDYTVFTEWQKSQNTNKLTKYLLKIFGTEYADKLNFAGIANEKKPA